MFMYMNVYTCINFSLVE